MAEIYKEIRKKVINEQKVYVEDFLSVCPICKARNPKVSKNQRYYYLECNMCGHVMKIWK